MKQNIIICNSRSGERESILEQQQETIIIKNTQTEHATESVKV
jgi:hypothetical protein